MSESINNRMTFKSLKSSIVRNKSHALIEKNSEVITLAFSDLIYSMTSDKNERINFKAIGLDIVIDSNDNIMLMENEDDAISFYEIDEGPLVEKIYEFLSWRISVLNELNF